MRKIPSNLVNDTLQRYESIGSRLDKLYKIIFSTTYFKDLDNFGFIHISILLRNIQTKRNEFMHGHPEAINDDLIIDLINNLKDEHEAWITIFNARATLNGKER